LKPLEFYGIPLDDSRKLLETPKDVLNNIMDIPSLHDIANKAFEIASEEESLKFFYQSVSHTNLQQEAFTAVISSLTELGLMHVKDILEAGT
jgi:hypothetical protein